MSAGKSRDTMCCIGDKKPHVFFGGHFGNPRLNALKFSSGAYFHFRCLCYFVYQILSRLVQVCWSYSRRTKSDNLKCCMLQHNKARNTETSRPAIAGNRRCKNITAKSRMQNDIFDGKILWSLVIND